jgi:hypothetical protein
MFPNSTSWNTKNNQTEVHVEINEVSNEVVHEVPIISPAPVTKVEVVLNEYNHLQWVDCKFNDKGKPAGLQGKIWNQLSVAKL